MHCESLIWTRGEHHRFLSWDSSVSQRSLKPVGKVLKAFHLRCHVDYAAVSMGNEVSDHVCSLAFQISVRLELFPQRKTNKMGSILSIPTIREALARPSEAARAI